MLYAIEYGTDKKYKTNKTKLRAVRKVSKYIKIVGCKNHTDAQ